MTLLLWRVIRFTCHICVIVGFTIADAILFALLDFTKHKLFFITNSHFDDLLFSGEVSIVFSIGHALLDKQDGVESSTTVKPTT